VLVLLGLVAAFCASLLVRVSRGHGSAVIGTSPDVEVAVSAKSLPAMSVITSADVSKDKVPRANLPKGSPLSPLQAVGRVLALPVVEGQILTESCLVAEGTGAHLAAALPPGMRAFTVTVSSQSISGGLLYPGCVVDVLASFRLPSSQRGQAVSTTLLHGVQVLAVRDSSVVSKDKDKEMKTSAVTGSAQSLTVTLQLDQGQSEALQLAVEHGSIALAMRNPLDKYPADMDGTVLSGGRLARLGYGPDAPSLVAEIEGQGPAGNEPAELAGADGGRVTGQQLMSLHAVASTGPPPSKPSWLVTVIRGSQVEHEEIDVDAGEVLAVTAKDE
jgi:pilus assembly protein CpaB